MRSIKFLGYSDYAIGRRLMTTTNDIKKKIPEVLK